MPDVTIHVFEAVPDTYSWMLDELESTDGMVLNQVALGDGSTDHLEMWTPRHHTEATAVREAGGDGPSVRVPATSGDRYVAEHGIDHIDLLKIDVEGFEWEVLRGFAETLAAGRVDVVQFEHTTWQAVPARRWLGDYVELLGDAGFVVGKLMPNHLDVHPYTYGDEQFPGANYVAVRRGSDAHRLLVEHA
jgi:FkbM family methyltransferase